MGLGHGASIVRSGLVLHLDAANTKSYPGTGTTWNDLSSAGAISTNYNSVLYNAAGYFNFDGTNQYSQGVISNFSNTAITFTSWCRLRSNPTGFSQVIGSAGSSGAIYIAPNSSNIFGQFSFTTNGNRGSGSTNIPLNTWKFITVAWASGSTIQLYVNGILANQSSVFTDTINIVNYKIAHYASGTYLNCDVSSASIYNRALSAVEIRQNFEALRGRYDI